VLTLTFDTPGSPINVFNNATADQLTEILAGVTPATTRAIVFETAKPNSFINGVGLLLAHASQSYDDILRASTPPWTAYRAVREAPGPTIAVVQGNCFGCGVELVLHCDYRIATDTCETRFYMTELNDYLFIPLFGSTWTLPETVGLEDAIDLLLWGERWSAATAYEHGLIDAVAPHDERVGRTQQLLERVLAQRQPSRRRGRVAWGPREAALIERARQRIATLPPAYQEAYGFGLELLHDGARQTRSFLDHQRAELRYSAATAISEQGKAAYSFFYIRQMAAERAAGRAAGRTAGASPAARLSIDSADDPEARRFAANLRARDLAGGVWCDNGAAEFRLTVGPASRRSGGPQGRPARSGAPAAGTAAPQVSVELSTAALDRCGTTLYAPNHRGGGRLLELATPADSVTPIDNSDITRLARTLQRLGFEVARTTPRDGFVSDRLLIAYLAPLIRSLQHGGDPRPSERRAADRRFRTAAARAARRHRSERAPRSAVDRAEHRPDRRR
jgi:enoyl-CoA hydratase/carnithine racemase